MDFNIFGSTPEYYSGLLGQEATDKLRKRATGTGIANALLALVAQPRNQGYGSALPYIGKALMAGQQAGQNVVEGGLREFDVQQRLADMKRKQEQQQAQQQFIQRLPENQRDAALAFPELGAKVAETMAIPQPTAKLLTPEEQVNFGLGDRGRFQQKADGTFEQVSGTEAPKMTEEPVRLAYEMYGKPINQLTPEEVGRVNNRIEQSKANRAPITNINMPYESNFEKTLGTKVAEQQLNEYDTAYKASNNIQKIDMTLKQIANSDATTGLGADVINNVNRFKAQFLADKTAGKKVADTQILDAFLGSEVFPLIGSLGIGARGLDTPAEREFLRQVMTGTINMDKNALLRMTKIRRDIEKRAIDKYNKGLKQGRYNKFFDATGYAKEEIKIPSSPAIERKIIEVDY